MSIAFTSWESGTEGGHTYSLDWSSPGAMRGKLPYAYVSALLAASAERNDFLDFLGDGAPPPVYPNVGEAFFSGAFNYVESLGNIDFFFREFPENPTVATSVAAARWDIDAVKDAAASASGEPWVEIDWTANPTTIPPALWAWQRYYALRLAKWGTFVVKFPNTPIGTLNRAYLYENYSYYDGGWNPYGATYLRETKNYAGISTSTGIPYQYATVGKPYCPLFSLPMDVHLYVYATKPVTSYDYYSVDGWAEYENTIVQSTTVPAGSGGTYLAEQGARVLTPVPDSSQQGSRGRFFHFLSPQFVMSSM